MDAAPSLELRQLGRSGLRVSPLSIGTWLTFGSRLAGVEAARYVETAIRGGVVLFDTAASYEGAEVALGGALRDVGADRDDFVVSTKLFPKRSLSRKHLMHAMEVSLERLGMGYVDVVSAHRYDSTTPLLETVRTMSDIISSGRAHYWGTSHWTASQIREAICLAQRFDLHSPICAQPGYSLGQRKVVEHEYRELIDDTGLGLMTYSPLGFGLLSGKYVDAVPEESRGAMRGEVPSWLLEVLTSRDLNSRVMRLRAIAEDVEATLPQVCLAWCIENSAVSTVIMSPETTEELIENLRAIMVSRHLNREVMNAMESLFIDIELEPDGI